MVEGDDFLCHALVFSEGSQVVQVSMNRTFARAVLGLAGDREEIQASIEQLRQPLMEEATDRRATWIDCGENRFICVLALTGVPEHDKGQSFPHFGWTAPDASSGKSGVLS